MVSQKGCWSVKGVKHSHGTEGHHFRAPERMGLGEKELFRSQLGAWVFKEWMVVLFSPIALQGLS